jgi:hypothetical protein
MTLTLNARTQKALAIAAQASSWTRLPTGAYQIPSQADPTHTYTVTPQSCSCPAAERHPEQLCKHSAAVAILSALLDADLPPPPAPLNEAEVAALFARL